MTNRICSVDDCDARHHGRGFCLYHYSTWKRTGDPMTEVKRKAKDGESFATFMRLVAEETDDCVEWPLGGLSSGYGVVGLPAHGVQETAHRLALMHRVGQPTPDQPEACHFVCHNPPCINYRHLRWGSSQDNSDDMVAAGRWRR